MPRFPSKNSQKGAALIVGLVLLLVLTLLAVAGMNTASLEILMAGNHQYRSRAIEAADAGIEVAYAQGTMNPIVTYNEVFAAAVPGSTDTYRAVVTPILNAAGGLDMPQAAPGFSVGSFAAYQFEIESTGSSSRNSTAQHTQELFLVAPAPAGTVPPIGPPGPPT